MKGSTKIFEFLKKNWRTIHGTNRPGNESHAITTSICSSLEIFYYYAIYILLDVWKSIYLYLGGNTTNTCRTESVEHDTAKCIRARVGFGMSVKYVSSETVTYHT